MAKTISKTDVLLYVKTRCNQSVSGLIEGLIRIGYYSRKTDRKRIAAAVHICLHLHRFHPNINCLGRMTWDELSQRFFGLPFKSASAKAMERNSLVGEAKSGFKREWSYSRYRASLYLGDQHFAIVSPDGKNALNKEDADLLVRTLNMARPFSAMLANNVKFVNVTDDWVGSAGEELDALMKKKGIKAPSTLRGKGFTIFAPES